MHEQIDFTIASDASEIIDVTDVSIPIWPAKLWDVPREAVANLLYHLCTRTPTACMEVSAVKTPDIADDPLHKILHHRRCIAIEIV